MSASTQLMRPSKSSRLRTVPLSATVACPAASVLTTPAADLNRVAAAAAASVVAVVVAAEVVVSEAVVVVAVAAVVVAVVVAAAVAVEVVVVVPAASVPELTAPPLLLSLAPRSLSIKRG